MMSENTQYRVKIHIPRQYSLVRYDVSNETAEHQKFFQEGFLAFSPHNRYIFLGEIPNLPGACLVTDDKGAMYAGYNTENFIELTDEELDTYMQVGYGPR